MRSSSAHRRSSELLARGSRRALVVSLAVVAAACNVRAPRVTGSFSSAGGDIGAYVKTPDRCESGGHWNFYGVVFFEPGSTTSVLELVQDPVRGWALKAAWPAKHDMAVLEGKDCSKLDVDLHVERTRNNPEGWASGSARFVCRTPGGSTLQGDLKFTNCR